MEGTASYADISVKARCADPAAIESILRHLKAQYIGEDHQRDTYYEVAHGKLKLREGNIEHLLTHYIRETADGQATTTVYLYEINPDRAILDKWLSNRSCIGTVDKRRKIFFIDNVKFHLDTLTDGGTFVEIEAIDKQGRLGLDKIRQQAQHFKQVLGIRDADLVDGSYIDIN